MENIKKENILETCTDLNLQKKRPKDENEFRKNEEFSDVIIKVKDGTEFKVHKIVLASGCPYFKALFNSGLKESTQKIIQLDRDITGEDMEKLLEYIYTGEIQLPEEKAKIFCEYALYFELINLKNYCANILRISLNLENCLEFWEHGVKFLNETLVKFCLTFLIDECSIIIQTNFLQLTNEQYREITCNVSLSAFEKLYLLIYNWIKSDYKTRKVFLNGLINYFNFSLLPNTFLIKFILQDKVLQAHKSFSKKFCEIFENKLGNPSNNESSLMVLPETTNYFVSMSKIYVDDGNEKVQNFQNGKTHPGFQALTYNYNTLFLSGGSSNPNCYYFCPSTNNLEIFPSMKYGRHNHSVINLNGKLYAMGGRLIKSVEIFDLGSEQWKDGPNLMDKSESIGLTTWENAIYLFGSFYKYKCSTTVERFDPAENKFTVVCEAPPIRKTKSVRVDDIVYCFNWEGGYKFNLRTNKWFEKIPKAPIEWTSITSAVLFSDFIAVLGTQKEKTVICFLDLINNIWCNDKFKLPSEDICQMA